MGKTLRAPATITGIGLFTERDVTCVILPSDGPGIEFEIGGTRIPATIDSLCTTPIHPLFATLPPRNTNLGQGAPAIITTEHVLSALAGLGITGAIIQLDAPELPIGDGSARHFVEAITGAALVPTNTDPKPIRLTQPILVEDGRGGSITAEPANAPHFSYELDYGPNAPIAPQRAAWSADHDDYASQVAPARTFSLAEEAAAMQSAGLFTRFTTRDLLVIGPDGPVDNELRFDNEPARHKLLDLIGDLALVARPLIAKVSAVRSGHALNHELARQIVEQSR